MPSVVPLPKPAESVTKTIRTMRLSSRMVFWCLLGLFSISQAHALTFLQVSGGYLHSCGVTTDNQLVCWGKNDYGQASPPSGSYRQVNAGNRHTCAVSTGGSVRCWGSNAQGQSAAQTGNYRSVSAGGHHSCGLTDAGGIKCWGGNRFGQSNADPGSFTMVAAGWQHSCGLLVGGGVTCWGDNYYGQVSPTKGSYAAITLGSFHTCALDATGRVTCWGDNSYGQSSPPSDQFVQISSGDAHVCGIKTNGNIACWGSDRYHQSSPPPGTFVQVDSGGRHTCARRQSGEAVCWGSNSDDQSLIPTSIRLSPGSPTTPNASDGTYYDRVIVTWNEVSSANYYQVYRASQIGSTGSLIASSVSTTGFEDLGVTPGVNYFYSVAACNAQGCSPQSAQDAGYAQQSFQPTPTPTLYPPTTPTGVSASDGTIETGVLITWTPTPNTDQYKLYRTEISGATGSLLTSTTTSSYLDTNVAPNTIYYYRVMACNNAGCSVLSLPDDGYLARVVATIGEAVDNTELLWSSLGNAVWNPVSGGVLDGDSAQSGDIGDTQSSILRTNVLGPGTLTFQWKISSEAGRDLLWFLVDGEITGSPISGEQDWQLQTFAIPAGHHELKWVYSKDASGMAGADAAWVDAVSFSGCDSVFDSVRIDGTNTPIGGVIALGPNAELAQDATTLLVRDPNCFGTLGETVVEAGSNVNLVSPTVVFTEGFQVQPGASLYAGSSLLLVGGEWYLESFLDDGCGLFTNGPYYLTLAQTGPSISFTKDDHVFQGSLDAAHLSIDTLYPYSGGELERHIDISFTNQGTAMSGTDEWIHYIGGIARCRGREDFVGTRQ